MLIHHKTHLFNRGKKGKQKGARNLHNVPGHPLGLVAVRCRYPGHLQFERLVLALVVELVQAGE